MTLVTSKVDICNLALGHLKIEPITDIETPNTNEESICARYYDITRQSVLESADWSFAVKRTTVAADTSTPAFGWDYQSGTLPADFLKLIGVYNSSGTLYINTNNQYYDFEGNKILANFNGPYYIKYLSDVTDVSKFDRMFVMNFSYALAVTMSEAFKTSATLLQVVIQKWEQWQADSLAVNGQQSKVVRVDQSPYITARQLPLVRGQNTREINV
jgi:hypothetical protein